MAPEIKYGWLLPPRLSKQLTRGNIMWYHDTLGLVRHPRELTISGVTYPRQIFRKWSKPELAEIGIRPARMEVVDQRYYYTGGENYTLQGNEWVISYGSVPKDADSLKKSMKEKVKQIASSSLAKSDWMVIREADGGTAMPEAWKTYRTSVRAESNEKEGEVDALVDLDAIMAYDAAGGVEAGWPNDPDYVAPPEEG